MRHQKSLRKFGRSSSQRKAMFRNLATSLFEHGKIETTVSKAKDLRRVAERLITLAGEDTLARRRQAYGFITKKSAVQKLFSELGPQYKTRPGGYTRIIRTRLRPGDASELAMIELVQEEYKPKKKTPRKKASSKETSAKKKAAPKKEAVEQADSDSEGTPTDTAAE